MASTKSCPYCGASRLEIEATPAGRFAVHCPGCHARGPETAALDTAVMSWNGSAIICGNGHASRLLSRPAAQDILRENVRLRRALEKFHCPTTSAWHDQQ